MKKQAEVERAEYLPLHPLLNGGRTEQRVEELPLLSRPRVEKLSPEASTALAAQRQALHERESEAAQTLAKAGYPEFPNHILHVAGQFRILTAAASQFPQPGS